MQTPLPASAFKHLEPYPGGNWTVSGETADTVTVSYSCGDNAEVVSYTLHRCRTEQDVMAQCQSLLYNFDTDDEKADGESAPADKEQNQVPASTIELKIEQVDDAPWTSQAAPVTADFFNYQSQINYAFSPPIQESNHVQLSTPEYAFTSAPSFDCQQQIPMAYNDSWAPINNYWPLQNEIQAFQGDFSASDEYHLSGEHQWIQSAAFASFYLTPYYYSFVTEDAFAGSVPASFDGNARFYIRSLSPSQYLDKILPVVSGHQVQTDSMFFERV